MRTSRTVGVGALVLSVILLAGTALSQTNAVSGAKEGVDLTPIIVALINLVFPAVAAVATYLINERIKNRQLAAQLSYAVENAMGTIQQHSVNSLTGRTDLRLTVNDPAIQRGVEYVVNNAAEAVAHFQIPTERIAQKLEAKVGLAAIQTNVAATASHTPGVTGPLAPVPAIHS